MNRLLLAGVLLASFGTAAQADETITDPFAGMARSMAAVTSRFEAVFGGFEAPSARFSRTVRIQLLQRGFIANNTLSASQPGNGSIGISAIQSAAGRSSIDNRIGGGIGY
ncbi:hypothetical protein [Inquilinus sp. CAU 1745]|uniref:hypothetical protein n=1 Tax=Inquilinus sp. CAU 1745 TaxID=3140369 RepID=UPI00325B2B7B